MAPLRARSMLAWAGVALLSTSCASPGSAPAPASAPATEAEWRALALPRPEPLQGAPRVTFAGLELNGPSPWSYTAPVSAELGVSELVAAGLLRRPDLAFVERRRFTVEAEAERLGRPRRPGAPPLGVSPGSELTSRAIWLPLGAGQAVLEVRLTSAATSAIVGSHRVAVPADPDMVGTARAIVGATLVALAEMGRLPTWTDPVPQAAPRTYASSGIPSEAVERFLRGLAAEELWNWEEARRSYEAAAATAGFVEAEAALARTARLRTGGTLGES